jgi:two-component system, NarL family, response regulator LiaR
MTSLFSRYKLVLIYGVSCALLLFVMKWLEVRFLILSHSMELFIGALALLFMILGIWLARKVYEPKVQTVIVEKTVEVPNLSFVFNEQEATRLGISKRELEVLELMSLGLSNQEIADRMFVSLNTVKTHASNLFAKLDVKRRTAAIETARKLNLVR